MSHVPAQNHPPAVDSGPSFDELKPALDPIVARYPVRAGAMLPVQPPAPHEWPQSPFATSSMPSSKRDRYASATAAS